ncbi:MAG: hypothetical protein HYZ53_28045, partial [Planctomycetes bacterium]|nr:hypothetical protein [Planctomycetota bacterium]
MAPTNEVLLGKLAIANGYLTPDQLVLLLKEQASRPGTPLSDLLLLHNYVAPGQLSKLLQTQLREPGGGDVLEVQERGPEELERAGEGLAEAAGGEVEAGELGGAAEA